MEDEENWEISHHTPSHILDAWKTLKSMGYPNSFALAVKFKGDVVAAIESVFEKPEVKGDKYIPSKPKVDSGLSPEQEELCKKGRWLQDKVNAVFSVAHSKIQNQHETVHGENQPVEPVSQMKVSENLLHAPTPDSHEQIVQQHQQSEVPPKTDS
jgi:hypothetical protein